MLDIMSGGLVPSVLTVIEHPDILKFRRLAQENETMSSYFP